MQQLIIELVCFLPNRSNLEGKTIKYQKNSHTWLRATLKIDEEKYMVNVYFRLWETAFDSTGQAETVSMCWGRFWLDALQQESNTLWYSVRTQTNSRQVASEKVSKNQDLMLLIILKLRVFVGRRSSSSGSLARAECLAWLCPGFAPTTLYLPLFSPAWKRCFSRALKRKAYLGDAPQPGHWGNWRKRSILKVSRLINSN